MMTNKHNKMYVRADVVTEIPEGFELTQDNITELLGGVTRLEGTTHIGTLADIFPDEPVKQIDWEERRYEIAKSVLASAINSPYILTTDETGGDREYAAKCAVQYADALIAELKKHK